MCQKLNIDMWWRTIFVVVVVGILPNLSHTFETETQNKPPVATWPDEVIAEHKPSAPRPDCFDDCFDCHTHLLELETAIQTLKAAIYEHVADASLRQRLLTSMSGPFKTPIGTNRSNASPLVHRQRDHSNADLVFERRAAGVGLGSTDAGCVPYPEYVDSGQCTLCGVVGEWAQCQGRCLQDGTLHCRHSWNVPNCLKSLVCIDCSDVTISSPPLEQVPCPPDGFTGMNTSNVILLLDNNHDLNIKGAFGFETPYSTNLAVLSLANTTLNASHFNLASMQIGSFSMQSATIVGEMNNNAFYNLNVYGNLDLSSTTFTGGISDFAFYYLTVDGNVDLSFANISGGIGNSAFSHVTITHNFSLQSAHIIGGISNSAFAHVNILGHFDMSLANVVGGIRSNAFANGVITNNFDMSSANIYGGISSGAFSEIEVHGNFNMQSLNIFSGFSDSAFLRAHISGDVDLTFANISNGITNAAFSFIQVHGDFILTSAAITGGINDNAFHGANISGVFDMRWTNVTGGITRRAFHDVRIGVGFDMRWAYISGGIGDYAFGNTVIPKTFDMSEATVYGGITDFAFANAFIGDLLFVETNVVDVGIQPGVFLFTLVSGVFNASGARFPHDTLPIQMLYGLEVQQGLDFSRCNLISLEQQPCDVNGGCFSLLAQVFAKFEVLNVTSLSRLKGGPFTGMAMPVGIESVTVNLGWNRLVEISASSLVGITATILDLSHNNISVYSPFWFLGVPNANIIHTAGNPSTCRRAPIATASYTFRESATIQCECSNGTDAEVTYGTGNFCARGNCDLNALNAYSQEYLGNGSYVSTTSPVRSGESVTLQCPVGTHPNTNIDSAVSAVCFGGAFEPQINPCVNNATPSWFTSGRIVGIVFGVLVIAGIVGYFLLLSPEKRKGQRLANELGLSVNEVELNERLLHETNCDLEEATALNTRMRGAWKIEETDIEIGVVLASGAFGVVHDSKFAGLRVAVKVLKQPLDEENYPDVGKDFTRECETLMAIRHACLLIFYGAGLTSENRPFMVTEFMSQGSLQKVLANTRQKLSWPMRHKFALQIAKAMEYLHGVGIVHRDLKSDNCLVNGEMNVKVCDFGTSKFLTPGRSTLQQSTLDVASMVDDNSSPGLTVAMTKGVGTMLWMAPELFVGETSYKQEVDMYSFGMIMWELAAREIPWNEIKEQDYIDFYSALCSALKNNRRPHIPVDVVESQPDFVTLMQQCWSTLPDSRPNFTQVVTTLSRGTQRHTDIDTDRQIGAQTHG